MRPEQLLPDRPRCPTCGRPETPALIGELERLTAEVDRFDAALTTLRERAAKLADAWERDACDHFGETVVIDCPDLAAAIRALPLVEDTLPPGTGASLLGAGMCVHLLDPATCSECRRGRP